MIRLRICAVRLVHANFEFVSGWIFSRGNKYIHKTVGSPLWFIKMKTYLSFFFTIRVKSVIFQCFCWFTMADETQNLPTIFTNCCIIKKKQNIFKHSLSRDDYQMLQNDIDLQKQSHLGQSCLPRRICFNTSGYSSTYILLHNLRKIRPSRYDNPYCKI